ncbi:DUF6415 family natural product biosynthesis protein [Streptomyces sp. NPDC050523]|uniref:DUF6415 family natural product biosynthesis protein n=1 Tax=Streptomyces sp. NPDC050523 TaxID=3365622 RepID=UPI00378EB030
MPHRTAQPTAAGLGESPPDIATMRVTVNRLLDPDSAPEALPPAAAEVDILTARLRGHVQLLAPEVELAARELAPGSIARYSVLGCVWEATSRLEAEPCQRYGGPAGYARRLARALNALCDHYEQLSSRP